MSLQVPLKNIQHHHAEPYQASVLLWSMVQGLLDINMPRSSLAATNIPLALNGGGGFGDFGFGLENTLLHVHPYLERL